MIAELEAKLRVCTERIARWQQNDAEMGGRRGGYAAYLLEQEIREKSRLEALIAAERKAQEWRR